MTDVAELEDLRRRIRGLTVKIFALIAKRVRLGEEIGRVKKSLKLPLVDDKVERELRIAVKNECVKRGIDEQFGMRVLTILLRQNLEKQSRSARKESISASKMFARAKELEKKGKKIIHLEVGEPDFTPPRRVLEQTKNAMYRGFTRYTVPSGIPELKNRIADHVSDNFGVKVSDKNIICTAGARFGIFASMTATLSAGSEVINIEPNWPAYKENAEFLGARVRTTETNLRNRWTPSLEDLENSINESTQMLVLSYPNNPTGKVLDAKTLDKIVEITDKHNIIILSDEVYADYSFVRFKSMLEYESPNAIIVSSFSKAYSMTGFRLGYTIAKEEILTRMAKIQELAILSLPHFIQKGAIGAFDDPNYVRRNVAEMKKRFAIASKLMKNMPFEFMQPEGGLYVFPKGKGKDFDGNKFAMDLLEKQGVAVTPGTGFGNYPSFFRISLNQPAKVLSDGIRRFERVLS